MSITAIIETPKGRSEKYNFDKKLNLFRLGKLLPVGMAFPYDFGFIPDTKGEDGDPLDVIVVSEFQTFPGCVIDCRIIGAILAEQTEKDGKTVRNDRFIGVPEPSLLFRLTQTLDDLPPSMITELDSFFANYNELEGKKFKPIGKVGPDEALKLIKEGR